MIMHDGNPATGEDLRGAGAARGGIQVAATPTEQASQQRQAAEPPEATTADEPQRRDAPATDQPGGEDTAGAPPVEQPPPPAPGLAAGGETTEAIRQRIAREQSGDVERRNQSEQGRNARFQARTESGSLAQRLRERGGSDPCATAAGIDRERFGCAGVQTLIQTSQATLSAGQQIGSVVISTAGQMNQMNAANSGGGQAAMMEAGANTQELGGNTQRVMGAVSSFAALAELTAAGALGSNANTLRTELGRDRTRRQINQNTVGYSLAMDGSTASLEHADRIARHEGRTITDEALNDTALAGAGHAQNESGFIDGSRIGGLAGRLISGDDDFKLNEDGDLTGMDGGLRARITQAEQDLETLRRRQPEQNSGITDADIQNAQQRVATLRQTRDNMIQRRASEIRSKQEYVGRQLNNAGQQAASEQGAMAQQAAAAGLGHLLTGAAQIVAGQMQVDAAASMREQIAKLRSDEARAGGNTFDLGGDDSSQTYSGGAPPSISGGNPETSASVEDASERDLPPSLGDPFNTDRRDTLGGVPAPSGSGFVDRAPAAGGPGGGGPGGGASAGASPQGSAATEDPQSKYMDLRQRGGGRYETGGFGRMAGGMGGGGGGGGGIGPDLSAMMEKFLGKKGEEGRGQGILDFGQGNARPGQQPYSLLDRNANIFERIHQTYQDRNRRGVIGL